MARFTVRYDKKSTLLQSKISLSLMNGYKIKKTNGTELSQDYERAKHHCQKQNQSSTIQPKRSLKEKINNKYYPLHIISKKART